MTADGGTRRPVVSSPFWTARSHSYTSGSPGSTSSDFPSSYRTPSSARSTSSATLSSSPVPPLSASSYSSRTDSPSCCLSSTSVQTRGLRSADHGSPRRCRKRTYKHSVPKVPFTKHTFLGPTLCPFSVPSLPSFLPPQVGHHCDTRVRVTPVVLDPILRTGLSR